MTDLKALLEQARDTLGRIAEYSDYTGLRRAFDAVKDMAHSSCRVIDAALNEHAAPHSRELPRFSQEDSPRVSRTVGAAPEPAALPKHLVRRGMRPDGTFPQEGGGDEPAAPPQFAQPSGVFLGPLCQQYPGGPIYRHGVSTGATMPEQPAGGVSDERILLAQKIEGLQDDGSEGYPFSQEELDLIIQALRESRPGFVSVPREPTEAMVTAGFKAMFPLPNARLNGDVIGVYKAMLAASEKEGK